GVLDDVLAIDGETRALRGEVEQLRSRHKTISKEIGKAKPEDRGARQQDAAALKTELQAAEHRLSELEARLHDLALQLPNPADPDVPDGGEDDGEVVRVVGDVSKIPPPLDHAALAEALGFVETRHAVEISGSRFASLMGA